MNWPNDKPTQFCLGSSVGQEKQEFSTVSPLASTEVFITSRLENDITTFLNSDCLTYSLPKVTEYQKENNAFI
ncbi:hypothetical protein ACQP3C_28585, partial [Escherichia coli]